MAWPAMISRRRFNQYLAGGLAAGTLSGLLHRTDAIADAQQKLRVAAIQMAPRLGDVAANLEQAEQLIRHAQKQKADWIALPEMFTTAAAFHPDLLYAIQPLDGAPAQLMKRLARQGNCVIGGSFLALRAGNAYNSFLLVFPDGSVLQHDKDLPTYWENCVSLGGDDDGVLPTPIGNVGSVLCWEFIRSQTARRLTGKVKLVIGGSCWWTLPDDADADSPLRATNLKMLQQAPVRFARMLGVPVIHGSHAGPFNGFFSPELPDVAYDSTYLGEAMIVDAQGNVLARRAGADGAGVVTAEISLPKQSLPSEPIPDTFWIPEEMPKPWKESWKRWFDTGSHYYQTVTKPYLDTGVINEYVPKYML
jgi:predicted amidohydrolase